MVVSVGEKAEEARSWKPCGDYGFREGERGAITWKLWTALGDLCNVFMIQLGVCFLTVTVKLDISEIQSPVVPFLQELSMGQRTFDENASNWLLVFVLGQHVIGGNPATLMELILSVYESGVRKGKESKVNEIRQALSLPVHIPE